MATGFGSSVPRRIQTHVVAFHDHAGNPALSVFLGAYGNPLPRLYSYSIYLTHPNARPSDTATAEKLHKIITQGPRYETNSVAFRLDMYFIPNGNRDDCIQHYRAEKNARGEFHAQIDAVMRDNTHPNSGEPKMPGLVPSYVYDKADHRYHNLIYVCEEADWQNGDQTMLRIEFDPVSQEQYEKFSKDSGDPDELPETHVEVCALHESSPGFDREIQPGRFVRSMGYEMWDRAPRENMGEEAWEKARDMEWTSW